MKFHSHRYWKHRGDCCDFIEVIHVNIDTGQTAELVAKMHTQSNKSWRNLSSKFSFRIPRKDYDKWQVYTPRGEYDSGNS